MLGNGHRLRHEPHTESLPGIRLNIKDLGDTVPKVLVLCKAPPHHDDGLVYWGHGPAPLGTVGPWGVCGGDPRWPSLQQKALPHPMGRLKVGHGTGGLQLVSVSVVTQ